ncbi:ABC transporter permease [Sphingobacterium sp. E70]|nr:ABC transporter permease [Sphingobacterium sp. E70]
MNLATAKSQKNAKEVGVNKVLGATRGQLIVRFFVETATISLFAMTIGVVLAIILIPLFNTIGNTNITVQQLLTWDMLGILALSWFIITFVAGSYPALFLSKIKSIALMNKGYNKQGKTVLIRQILVICQFTISIILIIGISVMLTQMNYIRNKDLGYQPEHVISIPIRSFRSQENSTRSINRSKAYHIRCLPHSYSPFLEAMKAEKQSINSAQINRDYRH